MFSLSVWKTAFLRKSYVHLNEFDVGVVLISFVGIVMMICLFVSFI